MKKLFFNTTLFLITLVLALSSCNDNEAANFDQEAESRPVSLRIVHRSDNLRGTSAHIPDNTELAFNTGILYLVSDLNVIIDSYIIGNYPTHVGGVDVAKREINRSSIAGTGSGVILPEVPGNVTRIMIVGNTPGAPRDGNVEAVGKTLLDITTQHNATDVNLWGIEPLKEPAGVNTAWTCIINLRPTVARFEIPDIRALGNIESFTVEGIFMDGFYRQSTIDGSVHGTPVNNITSPNHFTHEHADYKYEWDKKYAVHDVGAWTTTGTIPTAKPENNHVWAYQVFAQPNPDESVAGTAVPRIVIKLKDIKMTDGRTLSGARYVTISGFRQASSTTNLEVIRAGNIYRVTNLAFYEGDLKTDPDPTGKTVDVTVTLAKWNGETLHPERPFQQPNPHNAATPWAGTYTFNLGIAWGGSWGEVEYQWQSTTTPNVETSWQPITGATNPTYTTGFLTEDTWFRRVAIDVDAATKPEIRSAAAKVTITGRWARYNVDSPGHFADEPQNPGRLYQWGTANGVTHDYPTTGDFPDNHWDETPASDRQPWEPWNVPCPTGYRLPTVNDFSVLIAASPSSGFERGVWLTYKGVGGRCLGPDACDQCTGLHAIFFPATGMRQSGGQLSSWSNGLYWTGTNMDGTDARYVTVYETGLGITNNSGGWRSSARAIRCVEN